nr:DNA cytosine methyltransferase [Cellulomonas hominis]
MFTGIGGFEVGIHAETDWEPTVMVEFNKNCQRVLSRHFPNTPLMGDIRDVAAADLGRPDIAFAGIPCQDLSGAAPHRLGLAGARSGMFWEFARILDEHPEHERPRWVVIENPDGLLRSPGRGKDGVDRTGWDAATVFGVLEELGYGWAYRVVDGRHLGTPQRRRRVLVVAHRGGDPRPAWAVLGDEQRGGEAARPGVLGRNARGPRPALSPVGPDGALIWRKSARARTSLVKGGYETWVADGDGNTLTGYDGGGPLRQTHLIAQAGRLRTLSVTEWERLQGFPDGWTSDMPLTARWTALGNAVHTGTSAWLARRLAVVDAAVPLVGA